MSYKVEVGRLHSFNNLLEVMTGLLFRKIVILNIVIKLSAFGHLHDHKDISSRIQDLIKLDYIGMVDELQDLDFPFDLCGN